MSRSISGWKTPDFQIRMADQQALMIHPVALAEVDRQRAADIGFGAIEPAKATIDAPSNIGAQTPCRTRCGKPPS